MRLLNILVYIVFSLMVLVGCKTNYSKGIAVNSVENSTATTTPDRINISFVNDPSTSFAVTWRTNDLVKKTFVEFAEASDSSTGTENNEDQFEMPNREEFKALTEKFMDEGFTTLHHSYVFNHLKPETVYAFRVGDGKIWSEWFQYKTASKEDKSFSFIYLGDAQNNVKSMWSRTIRQAFKSDPDVAFILHAGDMINNRKEWEWDEWFQAGSFIHSMIPVVPVAGNHEHYRGQNKEIKLMKSWTQQFTLPKNGPESSEESDYYFDYQNVRFIILNSSMFRENKVYREEQKKWLHKILSNNANKWTVISYHIPIQDKMLMTELKPILDKYNVDLALQGHVHSYSRGTTWENEDYDNGPMYTVSVSGPKFYDIKDFTGFDMMRSGHHKQLYQILNVKNDTLNYKAYTTIGELYDEFEIVKKDNKKQVINYITD